MGSSTGTGGSDCVGGRPYGLDLRDDLSGIVNTRSGTVLLMVKTLMEESVGLAKSDDLRERDCQIGECDWQVI